MSAIVQGTFASMCVSQYKGHRLYHSQQKNSVASTFASKIYNVCHGTIKFISHNSGFWFLNRYAELGVTCSHFNFLILKLLFIAWFIN